MHRPQIALCSSLLLGASLIPTTQASMINAALNVYNGVSQSSTLGGFPD